MLLTAILLSHNLPAQTIENNINLYGTNFPQERIHIHFDKETYLPGETIWFKAYLFEENLPSNRSTNFYAALYDDKGRMLQQHISPVFNGSTDGHFTLPDTLLASQLICRAYTGWMLNFDTAFLYTRTLQVNNNKPIAVPDNDVTAQLQFFPEGGNILEGAVNSIAFKANYTNGLPFNVDAVIKRKETGEVIMPLQIQHDGMGKFDIEINQGDKFYAEWLNSNGIKQQTWLPDAVPTGVSLKLSVQKDKIYYNLINKTGKDSLHILMYMYQKVFYQTAIKADAENPYTGVLAIGNLPSGAMQLTVFDANWQPAAERVAFINNNNFLINGGIIAKTISTEKRGKNLIDILMADTIATDLSLSIVDADMYPAGRQNNIISDFLLRSELKGYVHNPAFYFAANTDAAAQRSTLDLVMLTHGWRRYVWAAMMEKQLPVMQHTADDYLQLYGLVGKDVINEIGKDESVNLIVKTKDSISSFYPVLPDKEGYIRQGSLIFYDSARIYYSFNKSKLLNSKISFSNTNSTLAQPAYFPNYKNNLYPVTVAENFAQNNPLFQYYKANGGIYRYNAEKTLQTVTIKTNKRNWKNDPIVKLEQRYTSGWFSGGALSYSFDVMHDEKAWTKLDMINYLRGTVPGLLVGLFDPILGSTITYRDKPVLIYIDEHEAAEGQLENVNLKDVALIKFIPNYLGKGGDAAGGAINPAIAVYYRKGADFTDRAPKETDIRVVKVAGYTPLKEFYSPDYSLSNTTGSNADARTTLLWMPYIFTDNANRKVPVSFYNNDFTKRMLVILEGVNKEGKMIYIEKLIE